MNGAESLLRTARAAGIDNIMALRGDPPQGAAGFKPVAGGLQYANELVSLIREQYESGFITESERYNQVIDVWTRTNNRVSNVLYDTLKTDHLELPVRDLADRGEGGGDRTVPRAARGAVSRPGTGHPHLSRVAARARGVCGSGHARPPSA